MFDIWKYFQSPFHTREDSTGRHDTALTQLQQGRQLLQNRKQIASREGFTGANGTASTDTHENSIQTVLDNLETKHDEFIEKIQRLSLLESIYHTKLDEYRKRMNSGIAGKNIQIGETIYYITKYGYYREYGTSSSVAWVNRNSRCVHEGDPIPQQTSIDRLDVLAGPPMEEKTVCGYEGDHVRYNNQVAYVKMNGEVLLYTNPLQPGDVSGCAVDPADIKDVDEATWTGLMADLVDNMFENTKCGIESLDIHTPDGTPVKDEIAKLVPKIKEMAQTIQRELSNIQPLMASMNNMDAEQKAKFSIYSQELNQITDNYQNDYTLDALHENMFIMERQQYYQYIVYFVIIMICFGLLYYLAQSIGGVAKQITESVQFVGDNVGRFGRGAPRQSVLRREAKDASAFGGVGFNMESLNPFSSPSSPSSPKMASPVRPTRPIPPKPQEIVNKISSPVQSFRNLF